jgi:GxxExxY protein
MFAATDAPDLLSHAALGAAIAVHRALGPGLLESVYSACLAHELAARGVPFVRDVRLPVQYDGLIIGSGLRFDFLVDRRLVLELKSVEKILPVHKAQVITYLRLGPFPTGLLINFNVKHLMSGVTRLAL